MEWTRIVNGRFTLPPRRAYSEADVANIEAVAAKYGIDLPTPADAERAALNSLAWARARHRQRPPNGVYRSFLQAKARDAANCVRAARARELFST